MRIITVLLLAIGVIGCQSKSEPTKPVNKEHDHKSHDHGDAQGGHSHAGHKTEPSTQSGLTLHISPSELEAGKPTNLMLMVHDAKNKMLTEFEPTHEKLVHLILIDKGMANFAHLHPEVSKDGGMTVSHTFKAGGEYYVYADVKPKGGSPATIRSKVVVKGEAAPAAPLASTVPGVVKGEGWNANVTVSSAIVGEATIAFEFSNDGKPVVDLQPYLGAMGHLVVVNTKDGDYAHAHPNEKQTPGKVSFMIHFATSGIYKGWGQFKRSDMVFDVPFVVHVK